MMKVESLFVYPIKSCGGIEMNFLELLPHGPRHDREFMVVDPAGKFLTQRDYPRLCLVQTSLQDSYLIVCAGTAGFRIDLKRQGGDLRDVVVWGDQCTAFDQGDEAADVLSGFLGTECRLVRQDPAQYPRLRTSSTLGTVVPVSFADAWPLLVISRESLYDLNLRLSSAIGMDRFRPNIVVGGTHPYAEDAWAFMRIGSIVLQGATACVRCVTTTTEQTTGLRSSWQEPLRTLAQYRKTEKGVIFGRNFFHANTGIISVGAGVYVA